MEGYQGFCSIIEFTELEAIQIAMEYGKSCAQSSGWQDLLIAELIMREQGLEKSCILMLFLLLQNVCNNTHYHK